MKKSSKFLLIIFMMLAFFTPQYLCAEESYLAPDFRLPDLSQGIVTLSSYRNKQPVILFFWTTWCPFCRKELRALRDMRAELLKDKVEILTINVGEYAYKIDNFIKSYQLTYKVLLDKDATVAESYGILGVPTYILIDKGGNIRFKENFFPKEEYKDLISE